MSRVDLLFLAKNRLAFTQESFGALVANTDLSLVRHFHVHDDGSVDGTKEFLQRNCEQLQGGHAGVKFWNSHHGSPVIGFNFFIGNTATDGSEYVAKVDNDVMCPPSWLATCLQVLDDHPELQCLGIEAFQPVDTDTSLKRTYEPFRYTGGIGVFRRSIFESLPIAGAVYFGLQIWQEREKLVCGWLKPALPVFLLDHLPFEPWRSLSATYVHKGWQRRQWGEYGVKRGEGFHDHGIELWGWRFPESR